MGSTHESTEGGTRDAVDVVVIGAGQAGLALGYFLRLQDRRFVILDRADSVGSAWRERWESLTLFTPRRYSALPQASVPRRPRWLSDTRRGDCVPRALRRDLRAADRAEQRGREGRTRRRRALPPRGGRTDDSLPTRSWSRPGRSRFRTSRLAEKLADDRLPDARRRLSTSRRRSAGTVLVVGGGNTGFQIAKELSATPHGRPFGRFSPEAVAAACARARSLLVADEDGTHQQDGRLAHRPEAEDRDTLIGSSPRELRKRHGVELEAARRRRRRAHGYASRTAASSRSTLSSGRPATAPTTAGSTCRSSTRTAAYATAAASPMSPASSSSA